MLTKSKNMTKIIWLESNTLKLSVVMKLKNQIHIDTFITTCK